MEPCEWSQPGSLQPMQPCRRLRFPGSSFVPLPPSQLPPCGFFWNIQVAAGNEQCKKPWLFRVYRDYTTQLYGDYTITTTIIKISIKEPVKFVAQIMEISLTLSLWFLVTESWNPRWWMEVKSRWWSKPWSLLNNWCMQLREWEFRFLYIPTS